jgi:hypothetical protein
MTDGKAHDPVQVVRDILAAGPLSPPDFRRLANERGVSFRALPKAARLAGAECRRHGAPGKGGWVWDLRSGIDRFIVTKPNRSGYYCDNLFLRGKEIQHKLADDLPAARVRVAELLKERDAERERDREAKRRPPTPPVPRGVDPSPRKIVQPIHVQLRDLARQLYRLARTLEKEGQPCLPT